MLTSLFLSNLPFRKHKLQVILSQLKLKMKHKRKTNLSFGFLLKVSSAETLTYFKEKQIDSGEVILTTHFKV